MSGASAAAPKRPLTAPSMPTWLYASLGAFLALAYAALVAPGRFEAIAGLGGPSELILFWLDFGLPIVLLAAMLIAAGPRRLEGSMALARLAMLAAAASGSLYALSGRLEFVPEAVKQAASPTGVVVSLIWVGRAGLYPGDEALVEAPVGRRATIAAVSVALVVALALYARPDGARGYYALALLASQTLVVAIAALRFRRLSAAWLAPLVAYWLAYLAAYAAGLLPEAAAAWIPAAWRHAPSVCAVAAIAALSLSDAEARP